MADGGFNLTDAITDEANAQGVDPGLALSIGRAESNLNPNVPNSPKGARGPMQVMQSTAPGYDLTDPAANVRAGVRYIKTLSDKYHGDHALIAAAYNAGPGAVDKHGGVPPFPETQAYVAKVTGEPSLDEVSQAYHASQDNPQKSGAVTVTEARPATPEELSPGEEGPSLDEVQQAYLAHGSKPPQDAEPPATVGSVAAQAGQGALNGVAGLINTAENASPANVAMKAGASAIDFLKPMLSGKAPDTQVALSDLLGPGPMGVQAPQLVGAPRNFSERAGNVVGELLPGAALGPEGETGLLGQLAYRAKNVLYPAVTGTAAGEAVHAMGGDTGEVQTAQALGSIPGAVAAVPNALEGIVNTGKNVSAPFLANVSTKARETQAGQALANAAGEGFKPAVSALEGYTPHVPGSPATVGDVTGNLGLIGLSRNTATKGSEAYTALTEQQAAARRASLDTLSTGASPAAVADHVRSTVADLDARTDAAVQAATAKARQAAEAVGGTANPETNGAAIRDAVKSSLDASDAQERKLWQAIDPDKSLTGNVTATRLAAKNIAGNVSPYDVPMNADEQRIFAQAQALPDVAKLSDITALRRSINDAASTEFANNGATATYARLSALRSALSDNLANTIGDAVVKSGANAALNSWLDGTAPAAEAATGTTGGLRGDNQPDAGTGASVAPAAGGTALPAGGQPGSAAGNTGLSGEISPDLKPITLNGKTVGYTTPSGSSVSVAQAKSYKPAESPVAAPVGQETGVQPTIDTDARARMTAANQATSEQAQTFRQGPVSKTLQTYGYAGQYRMPNGAVPGQFFKAGPTGYEAMQALQKASPEAMPAIQDYAASTLRDMATDGVITPKVLERWQARYGDAIRALPPELQAKFSDAAKAGQTVADAMAARTEALASAQSGAIGKIMGATEPDAVVKTVGNILRGTNATADMQSLVDATRSNPQARDGLKQAVVDHIVNSFVGNTEAGAAGVNKISADKFQTFLKTAGPALQKVFTPEEINRLTNIGRDIQQSQRTLNATKLPGQSNTAQDIHATGLPGGKGGRTVLDILAASLGGIVAHHAGAGGGIGGDVLAGTAGIASGYLTDLMQGMRLAGINKVNDLVKAAVFDPTKAAALMRRVNGPQDLTAKSEAGRAILKAFLAPTSALSAQGAK